MAGKGLPLGIDVGGSGIKGAPVDLGKGAFAANRLRTETPQPATPEAVCAVIADIVGHFGEARGDAPVGVTIPGVVRHGVVQTAANIDTSWIGFDAEAYLAKEIGRPVHVVNDADAAGVAELEYGAGDHTKGLVILTTLGTGIGTALLYDGELIPNAELGHIEMNGGDAERQAAQSAQERENLSWEQWAARLHDYYTHLESLLWPELFLVGGGVSTNADKFLPLLDIRTPIKAATLRNKAGIIGAAHLAVTEAAKAKAKSGKK